MKYIKQILLNSDIPKDSYLQNLSMTKYLSKTKKIDINKDVTFFVGENGSGKSTLLEAIAVALGYNPEGGNKNFSFQTNETHSNLYKHITLIKNRYPKDGFFLRAESFYNVSSYIDEIYSPWEKHRYGDGSLHKLSHGESFLSLIQNGFGKKGLYILDEPEAALSPMRIMTIMIEIKRLVNEDCQFIIATHSPILMALPDAQILEFSEDGINEVDYKDTDHYRFTKEFIEDPERMMHYLFED